MSNLMGKVAIVTGSSRGIGRSIAERLAQNGASVVINYSHSAGKAKDVVAAIAVVRRFLREGFKVRAIARRPEEEAAQTLAAEGAEIIQADLSDHDSVKAAMSDVYGAYLVLPFFQDHQEREVEMGKTVIDAAQAAGIQHLIYSAGSRSNERTGVPHLDSKGEIERYLRSSGVPYTVLRPVAFNYSLEAYRESVLNGELADPRDGDSVVYQLAEEDHATFATMALLDPQSWLWQGFDTASDALTVRELAAVFGRVVGRTVEYVQIDWEAERQVAGDEVVYLTQWVDREGPQINMKARRQKYPWLTPLEHYLMLALIKLGSIFDLPMIVLGDEGSFRGHFFPEITEYLARGQRVERHTPSAWHEPAFVEALQQSDRPKVIMAGISIDNCLMQTALDVLRAGYEVYVVVDASGTESQLVETAAMLRLTQVGAVMTNWVSIASELLDDWNNPQAEAVGELYQKYSKWGGNFILRKLKQLQ